MSHGQRETTDRVIVCTEYDNTDKHRKQKKNSVKEEELKESERIQQRPTNGDICWKTPRRSDESTTDAYGGASATAVSSPANRAMAWRRGSLSIRRSLRSMMHKGPLASTAGVWPGLWSGASGEWANGGESLADEVTDQESGVKVEDESIDGCLRGDGR